MGGGEQQQLGSRRVRVELRLFGDDVASRIDSGVGNRRLTAAGVPVGSSVRGTGTWCRPYGREAGRLHALGYSLFLAQVEFILVRRARWTSVVLLLFLSGTHIGVISQSLRLRGISLRLLC